MQPLLAVVGVSSDPGKYGNRVFCDLVRNNYQVVGIHPKAEVVCGRQLFSTIKDVKEKIDMVITVVPPEVTRSVIDHCVEVGVSQIWMQPGSGTQELAEYAEGKGLEVTWNACFMKHEGIW